MLKKMLSLILAVSFLTLAGCNDNTANDSDNETNAPEITTDNTVISTESEVNIVLANDSTTVNGKIISANTNDAVYMANDIIYYESGHDSTYGEGTEADAHEPGEAAEHIVIHITEPGTYRVSGKLEKGQLFINLGEKNENAKKDPNAVVTLLLENVDITCTVAPAVLFYDVYECGDKEVTNATAIVDTAKAGANVIIADDCTNNINGSYVAKIYEPGTTDKLAKFDGAFYSKRSLNISSEEKGTGILNIVAENEGLDSELHLTVNGGNINISSGNDGINTNEDNISVTTVNGGSITINAGLGDEGDGIDSNGYIVINGGSVLTSACDRGPDGGIDSDCGIIINGGTVIACGNQNGAISSQSAQNCISARLQNTVSEASLVTLSNGENTLIEFNTIKPFSAVVISAPDLQENESYTFASENIEMTVSTSKSNAVQGGMGGMMPPMQRPEGQEPFRAFEAPESLDEWLSETEMPDEIRAWIESMRDFSKGGNNRKNNQGNFRPEDIPQK